MGGLKVIPTIFSVCRRLFSNASTKFNRALVCCCYEGVQSASVMHMRATRRAVFDAMIDTPAAWLGVRWNECQIPNSLLRRPRSFQLVFNSCSKVVLYV